MYCTKRQIRKPFVDKFENKQPKRLSKQFKNASFFVSQLLLLRRSKLRKTASCGQICHDKGQKFTSMKTISPAKCTMQQVLLILHEDGASFKSRENLAKCYFKKYCSKKTKEEQEVGYFLARASSAPCHIQTGTECSSVAN